MGGGLAGGALRGLLEDLPLICDVAEVLISYAPDMFQSYPEVEAAKVCVHVCACVCMCVHVVCLSLCVCVCVRARVRACNDQRDEREREKER